MPMSSMYLRWQVCQKQGVLLLLCLLGGQGWQGAGVLDAPAWDKDSCMRVQACFARPGLGHAGSAGQPFPLPTIERFPAAGPLASSKAQTQWSEAFLLTGTHDNTESSASCCAHKGSVIQLGCEEDVFRSQVRLSVNVRPLRRMPILIVCCTGPAGYSLKIIQQGKQPV